jgi:hypothetical protein
VHQVWFGSSVARVSSNTKTTLAVCELRMYAEEGLWKTTTGRLLIVVLVLDSCTLVFTRKVRINTFVYVLTNPVIPVVCIHTLKPIQLFAV